MGYDAEIGTLCGRHNAHDHAPRSEPQPLRHKALVERERSLGLNRLERAVKHARIHGIRTTSTSGFHRRRRNALRHETILEHVDRIAPERGKEAGDEAGRAVSGNAVLVHAESENVFRDMIQSAVETLLDSGTI